MRQLAPASTLIASLALLGTAAAQEKNPAPTPAPAEAAAPAAEVTLEADPDGEAAEAPHRWHLELAVFPRITQQQIEGPNRDDLLTNDAGISTAFSASYAPIPYIEPGIWVQLDAGSVRRAVFSRPDENGDTSELQEVDGSYWSLWMAFMLRGRLGPAFAEVGWAPLILRDDTTRADLPNTKGETDGVFVGSRSVAWILGGGASIPVFDNFDITLRMQFRIRYLVSRGGEPLADEEETGQMTLWPYVGGHFHF